eukprot:3993993-Prymnesium_polylepis.1
MKQSDPTLVPNPVIVASPEPTVVAQTISNSRKESRSTLGAACVVMRSGCMVCTLFADLSLRRRARCGRRPKVLGGSCGFCPGGS